jgi:4-amino-4-deoxy-L-arabinose transferase-like glycosyltransferase
VTRSPAILPLALVVLIATASAFNLAKPVHIDDPTHLDVAAHVADHPSRPMEGMLHWGGRTRPAFQEMNQPPLFHYLLAASMHFFTPPELAGHVVLAVASGLVILFCFGVARRLVPDSALVVTAVCALSPAFLPAQNIMTDVPMLAFCLAAVYFLLRAQETSTPGPPYLLAGLALAAACLLKYTSLGLLAAFAVVLIGRRHWRWLWSLAIPLGALAAWSLWSDGLYGRSHLMTRVVSLDPAVIGVKSIDWLSGVGLAVPGAWLMLASRPFSTWTLVAGGLATTSAAAMLAVMLVNRFGDAQAGWVTALLVANGVAAIAAAVRGVVTGRSTGVDLLDRDRRLVLGFWLVGAAGAAIVLAPFMALRHVLFAVPPIVLLGFRGHEDWMRRRTVAFAMLVVTALPGAALAAADFAWAAVYPRYVAVLAERYPAPSASVVTVGHWGWQWYARRRGWQSYDPRQTTLRTGDLVFEPIEVTRPLFSNEHARRLILIGEVPVPVTALTTIRTPQLYTYSWRMGLAPIAVSRSPVETFRVYRANGP